VPTAFDPDAGVLRLGHAALSVLARLASDPTDPALRDHAVAPPLAELRAAGILGPAGIHPDVRPLAEVLGSPGAVLELAIDGGGAEPVRARGWVTAALVVVAVPAGDGAYDLVAESTPEAPTLLGDLAGLPSGFAADMAEVVVPGPDVAAALGTTVRRTLLVEVGDALLEVVDTDDLGLWERSTDGSRLVPTDAAGVRRRLGELLWDALRPSA
jgi:hypothetical protein